MDASRMDELDWRGSYPWGRQAPAKRLEDLRRRRRDVIDRRTRLEEVFRERMIDMDRAIEAIDQDIEIAQKCEADRVRRAVRAAQTRLEKKGVDVGNLVKGREPDASLLAELEAIERGAATPDRGEPPKPARSVEVVLDDGKDSGDPVDYEDIAGLARGAGKL